MIELLFPFLIAFSCFEGSDSENKCGNVEQKTVEPPKIICPNKPKITNPIWKPVPPEYLKCGYLTNPECPSVNKEETEVKPSNPSCPNRNDTPKADDSGKESSEKPPVEEKQGCSGSDNIKTEQKKTECTHFRRPLPERSYLDI